MGPFRNAARVGLECLWGVRLQAWSAHCTCLLCIVLKQCSYTVASPGTMLAPALSTDREQQQQHILTPASAKPAPELRHAHQHLWGSKAHTQAHTRTHNANAHMHTHQHTRVHTHTHTHKHTDTRTHAHTCMHARTHTYIHKHTHANVHALRCACDGLRQIFSVASDAPLLVQFVAYYHVQFLLNFSVHFLHHESAQEKRKTKFQGNVLISRACLRACLRACYPK